MRLNTVYDPGVCQTAGWLHRQMWSCQHRWLLKWQPWACGAVAKIWCWGRTKAYLEASPRESWLNLDHGKKRIPAASVPVYTQHFRGTQSTLQTPFSWWVFFSRWVFCFNFWLYWSCLTSPRCIPRRSLQVHDFGQDAEVIFKICGSEENSCSSQIFMAMFRAAFFTVARGLDRISTCQIFFSP